MPVMEITPNQPSNLMAQTSDPEQLAQPGREFYRAGQFQQAATFWQQAANAYQAQQDVLNQGMALSNLSLSLQQLGEWQPAEKAIIKSLQLLLSPEVGDSS